MDLSLDSRSAKFLLAEFDESNGRFHVAHRNSSGMLFTSTASQYKPLLGAEPHVLTEQAPRVSFNRDTSLNAMPDLSEREAPSGRVLLAEDNTEIAKRFRDLLEPEFSVIGHAMDGRDAILATQKLHPDVLLLDISMPVVNGYEVARWLRKEMPGLPILFISVHGDLHYLREAFRVGAAGYVRKRTAGIELAPAIRQLLSGRSYVTRDLAQLALVSLSKRERAALQLLTRASNAKRTSGERRPLVGGMHLKLASAPSKN